MTITPSGFPPRKPPRWKKPLNICPAKCSGTVYAGAQSSPGCKGNLLVQPEQGHIYAWDVFRTKVLTEKVGCLQSFFGKDNAEHGNAMLYNLLALLREAENDRINLARYAYLLARLSPKRAQQITKPTSNSLTA